MGIIKISKSNILTMLLIMFPLSAILDRYVSVISYWDETISLVSIVYLFLSIYNYSVREFGILVCIVSLIVVGLLSNVVSGLPGNMKIIILDIIMFMKPYIAFLGFSIFGRKHADMVEESLLQLRKICKGLMWIMLLTSLATQAADIGMSTYDGSGPFMSYGFLWQNGIKTAWLLVVCLIIIFYNYEKKEEIIAYSAIFAVVAVLTFKSNVLTICMVYFALMLFFRKKNKINVVKFLPFVGVVVGMIWDDLILYLTDETSPRSMLISGGLKAAKKYCPFGAGFATYGTEMANRHYSKLYELYGFTYKWGMEKNGNQDYLNDVYFGAIAGQFGYIGLIVFLLMIAAIFQKLNCTYKNIYTRAVCMAGYFGIVASMVASAASKSAMAIMVYAVLAMVSSVERVKREQV